MARRQAPRSGLTVVLDNEPLSALFRTNDRKHKTVLAHLQALRGPDRARSGRVLVARIVRVEAVLDYQNPATIAGRKLADLEERELDSAQADRAAARQARFDKRDAVDAVVAQLAVDEAVSGTSVLLLTSDIDDMPVLTSDADGVDVTLI